MGGQVKSTHSPQNLSCPKSPKQPDGVTLAGQRSRARTDAKIVRAIRNAGELTLTELRETTGLVASTVWTSIDRLERAGVVREIAGSARRVGARGQKSRLYELGDGREHPTEEARAEGDMHPLDAFMSAWIRGAVCVGVAA
jgi:hypothetical protein